MSATNELDRHLERVIDDGGCMVWQGGHNNGHPSVRINGETKLLRRLLWEREHGDIPTGLVVRMTCGTRSCVNPKCAEIITRGEMAKINGAKGHSSGMARSAAIASVKRAGRQAKLTPLAVIDIRTSGDTQSVLAARWGVSQGHISNVKSQKTYRDFSSPWFGLGARG